MHQTPLDLIGSYPVTGFQIHPVCQRLSIPVIFQILLADLEEIICLIRQSRKGLTADVRGDDYIAAFPQRMLLGQRLGAGHI